MKLFPLVVAALVVLTVVPVPASAASTSCGTPTRSLMEDPDGLDLPLDEAPRPAPLYTRCLLQFSALSGFTFSLSGDLTGEMQIQFTDPEGATQTYWYNVILGQATLEREIVSPLAGGVMTMDVKVRFTEPSVPGQYSHAVGTWRVTVEYA